MLVFGLSAQYTIAYLIAETSEITNTFKPIKTPVHDIKVKVEGEKKIEGRDWNDTEGYTIILQVKSDNQSAGKDEWISVGNASISSTQKTFDFTAQVQEAITQAGEYHFRIYEKQEEVAHMTYDNTVYEFKANVVTDEESNLSIEYVKMAKSNLESSPERFADVIADEDGTYDIPIEFINVYADPGEPPVIDVNINVNKQIEYLYETEGDKIGVENFEFILKENVIGEGSEISAITDKSGKAEFKLTYDDSDVGKTYSYILSEVNDGRDGIIYDETQYTIAVTISKDVDKNELLAEVKCNNAPKTEYNFTNICNAGIGGENPSEPTDPSNPSESTDLSDVTDSDMPSKPDKDDGSKTGDDTNLILPLVLLIASGAIIIALLLDRRKRRV